MIDYSPLWHTHGRKRNITVLFDSAWNCWKDDIQYEFDSVQEFYKELNTAKRENQNYKAACVEYEKIYGEKVVNTRSVREKIRQKEQIVKYREVGRVHQSRQKDKGAR